MQNSADVLNQLRDFQTKRRKPQDILAEEETKLGLPSAQQRLTGLRSAIGNTENLLRNVDPSVTGRTAGTFTTEAQRQKIVANERAPISDQFREQSRALEGETAATSDIASRALKAAQLGISDADAQENSLRTLYGSLYQREQDEAARQERERASRAAAAAQNAYLNYIRQQNQQPQTTAKAPESVIQEFKSPSGVITGYDTDKRSFLTDEGMKLQKKEWENLRRYGTTTPNVFQKFPDAVAEGGPMALIGKGWLW